MHKKIATIFYASATQSHAPADKACGGSYSRLPVFAGAHQMPASHRPQTGGQE